MGNESRIWLDNLSYTNLLFGRVLDVGAGAGKYSVLLRELPQISRVVSIDIFSPTTEVDGDWLQGTVEQLPFSNDSFDSVFCWRVMQYVPDGLKALGEFARVASRVMIRMPMDPLGKPPAHARSYREELATGLKEKLTWRTYWDSDHLLVAARSVGLKLCAGIRLDISGSMVGVFTR